MSPTRTSRAHCFRGWDSVRCKRRRHTGQRMRSGQECKRALLRCQNCMLGIWAAMAQSSPPLASVQLPANRSNVHISKGFRQQRQRRRCCKKKSKNNVCERFFLRNLLVGPDSGQSLAISMRSFPISKFYTSTYLFVGPNLRPAAGCYSLPWQICPPPRKSEPGEKISVPEKEQAKDLRTDKQNRPRRNCFCLVSVPATFDHGLGPGGGGCGGRY